MNLVTDIPVAITGAEPQGYTFALLSALQLIILMKAIDQSLGSHGTQGVQYEGIRKAVADHAAIDSCFDTRSHRGDKTAQLCGILQGPGQLRALETGAVRQM